jgi:hypothetical protein
MGQAGVTGLCLHLVPAQALAQGTCATETLGVQGVQGVGTSGIGGARG